MAYSNFTTLGVTLVILLTAYGFMALADFQHRPESRDDDATTAIVFWSSWITCAATGLGVIPFLFIKHFEQKWIAVGNSIAAGMMISASVGLIEEGIQGGAEDIVRVGLGFLVGIVFIWQSKKRLDSSDSFDEIMAGNKLEVKKMILVMCVMTLHSLSEGIGIGVSYHSHALGSFISATLAVHNVPEGLAIAMVMLPRGVHKANVFLWCVISSVPQPLMAVPAYLFVEAFRPLFALGLGFAGGAMLYVAILELLMEASEHLSINNALTIVGASATLMAIVQVSLRQDYG